MGKAELNPEQPNLNQPSFNFEKDIPLPPYMNSWPEDAQEEYRQAMPESRGWCSICQEPNGRGSCNACATEAMKRAEI